MKLATDMEYQSEFWGKVITTMEDTATVSDYASLGTRTVPTLIIVFDDAMNLKGTEK